MSRSSALAPLGALLLALARSWHVRLRRRRRRLPHDPIRLRRANHRQRRQHGQRLHCPRHPRVAGRQGLGRRWYEWGHCGSVRGAGRPDGIAPNSFPAH